MASELTFGHFLQVDRKKFLHGRKRSCSKISGFINCNNLRVCKIYDQKLQNKNQPIVITPTCSTPPPFQLPLMPSSLCSRWEKIMVRLYNSCGWESERWFGFTCLGRQLQLQTSWGPEGHPTSSEGHLDSSEGHLASAWRGGRLNINWCLSLLPTSFCGLIIWIMNHCPPFYPLSLNVWFPQRSTK